MSKILNFIDLNGNSPCEKIYSLLKTSSSKTNKEIQEKLENFSTSYDLISYYTKKDLKSISFLSDSLETIFEQITNFSRNSKNFTSEIDQYISNYSNILLVLNLISKYKKKLNQILINTKTYLSKIQLKNSSLELYNLSINKLLSNKRHRKYSRRSTKEDTLFSTENNFFKNNSENIIYEESLKDSISTAKFDDFENIENNETENLKNDSDLKSNGSQMTITKMVFTPVNNNFKYCDEFSIDLKKILKKSTIKEYSNFNIGLSLFSNAKSLSETKSKRTKMFVELLETINNMYKSCFISAEEKIELKQMLISNKNKLEKIYLDYNDKKDLLYKELKNLLQKENNL